MRNTNICILLQLILNFIVAVMGTTNGCSTTVLKAMKGTSLTAKLQIAPSSVHLKIHCAVPLEGNKIKKKPKTKHRENLSFAWLFKTFHISRGKIFQSCLLGGTLFLVFLVSMQYLLDNTWIIKCGDISHIAWLFSNYFLQQPSHDLSWSGFRKTFHHLQRRKRHTYFRTWVLL